MNTISPADYKLALFRSVKQIERVSAIPRDGFEAEYLSGAGQPVILTDVVGEWKASKKWNFEFFREKFGDVVVEASDRLRQPTMSTRMKLSSFLKYCQSTSHESMRWSNKAPLYIGLQPFGIHPELLDDFSQPAVVDCIYESLGGELFKWYVEHFGVLLIGSAGAATLLHKDLYGTHAWLAQLMGRKRWLVFAPTEADNLNDGRVSLLSPDLAAHPKLQAAEVYEATLSPGEIIFIPKGWYHEVVSLDPSISLSFNFVNHTNYLDHVLGICADLPQWAKRIDSRLRHELSISWSAANLSF